MAKVSSFLVAAVLTAAPSMAGVVYDVDKTTDDNSSACTASPNDCSLRGAITRANNDGSDSQVNLPDGLYQLTRAGAGEEFNDQGDLDVRDSLVIVAEDGATPTIEQTVADRVLEVHTIAADLRIAGPITITGGVLTGMANGAGIYFFGSGSLELESILMMGNHSGTDGGCLAFAGRAGTSVTLTEVTFYDCHSENNGGGARLSLTGSTATITSSRFESNTAYRRGAGLYMSNSGTAVIIDNTFQGNQAGHQTETDSGGGGIYASSLASLVLRQSTVFDNQAGVATTTVAQGGGVAVVGTATCLIENSTISGNRTMGINQSGAGLGLTSGSVTTLDHATVVDNATAGMDGIFFSDGGGGGLSLKNSIIDDGCSGNTSSIVSAGYNVERPWDGTTVTTCNLLDPSDQQVTDLMVRPLAGYGGPTETHALLSGSPADGLVGSAQCQAEDQRHAVRQGLFCDSGAFDNSSTPPGPWIFSDGFRSGNGLAWTDHQP